MANFTQPHLAREFMLAGEAIFTIRSHKTGDHFTYRVKQASANQYFIAHRTGEEFTYLAFLDNGRVRLTKASQAEPTSKVFRAFNYLWDRLSRHELPADIDMMHEGKCGKCGRPLTHPKSIETGLGPVCGGRDD